MPGLTVTSYACIDLAGAAVTGSCRRATGSKVSVRTSFTPILPILSAFGPFTFTTASSAKIQ